MGVAPTSPACAWCKGRHYCATCDGTGKGVGRKRFLHRIHVTACRACEGSGVCQLCKPAGQASAS
jgi:hypothetical protein